MRNKTIIIICACLISGAHNTAHALVCSATYKDGCALEDQRCCEQSLDGMLCGDGKCYMCCDSSTGGYHNQDDCTETDWADVSGTNYQSRTTCNSLTNTAVTQYRCQAGYYGTSATSTSVPTCTACTTATGNSAATSAAGAAGINSCYLPNGSAFSDTTGAGTYTSDCYWQ